MTLNVRKVLLPDLRQELHRRSPDIREVFVCSSYLSEQEVAYLKNYSRSFLEQATDFSFKAVTNTTIMARRDNRPENQKVKGASQNIFVGPSADIPSRLKNIFIKCAKLRILCLPLCLYSSNLDPLLSINGLGYPVLDIRNYPEIGGHLDIHTDPPSNQGYVGMVFMEGFHQTESGLYLELNGRKHFVDDYLKPGDAYIFHPSAPHGVINAGSQKNDKHSGTPVWDRMNGRWAVFCPWLFPS